jgi:putative transposase
MATGFASLIAIMDWHSRAVQSWKISNTMDTAFCVEALKEARHAAGCWPEIMNTDQGSQFTSDDWVSELKAADVQVSMDGKGCWVENEFIERLWRSLKYEDIYLREYLDVPDLESGVREWMNFYTHERRHQSLGDPPPWTVYQPSQAPLAA